jgi:hypothetical protein
MVVMMPECRRPCQAPGGVAIDAITLSEIFTEWFTVNRFIDANSLIGNQEF